jgi:cytochrome bd-type quinol oxidase subunit 1
MEGQMTAALATLDPIFLSRVQFGFVISFHIIFPSFTIGLAAWLATIEGVRLATRNFGNRTSLYNFIQIY